MLPEMVDGFGARSEEVTTVRPHVKRIEVVSAAAAVCSGSSVTCTVARIGSAMAGIVGIAAQNVIGGVTLLPNQGPGGVGIARKDRGREEVERINAIASHVGPIAR
jgi:hypothetical protein